MHRTRAKRIIDLAIYIIVVYLLSSAAIVAGQRSLMYHPMRELDPLPAGVESVQYRSADDITLTGWYVPAKDNKPTFVMFHGNAGNLSHRTPKQAFFTAQGYGFFLAEYRGYGPVKGKPNEEGFYEDGRAAIRWLIGTQNIPENNIVIYGESIGTGTASQMATEFKNIHALVLEAPFTSVPRLVRHIYPWMTPFAPMVMDKYDNIAKAPAFTMPVIIVHGTDDGVIPVSEGKTLFAAIGSSAKKLLLIPGGHHNDLADFGMLQEIGAFVSAIPIDPPATQPVQ